VKNNLSKVHGCQRDSKSQLGVQDLHLFIAIYMGSKTTMSDSCNIS